MLANATRICDAKFGHLFLSEGDDFRVVALQSVSRHVSRLNETPSCLSLRRAVRAVSSASQQNVMHISDVTVRTGYFSAPGWPRLYCGAKTFLIVPMLKDETLIGAITIYRQEVRPFTDKQIDLVSELRRASRHRHREHAAAQRIARIAGAADRDLGGAARSSALRRASWIPSSRLCWITRCVFAMRNSAICSLYEGEECAWPPASVRRRNMPNFWSERGRFKPI